MAKIYLVGGPAIMRPETACERCMTECYFPSVRVNERGVRKLTYNDLDDVIEYKCVYCGKEDEDLKAECEKRHAMRQ